MPKRRQLFRATNGTPVSSLKYTASSTVVHSEIMSVSARVGGPEGSSSDLNCVMRNQKMKTYCAPSKAIWTIFSAALLATPFTIAIDMLLRDSTLPMAQIITAASRFVIIGISIWLVKKFMAGACPTDDELRDFDSMDSAPVTNAKEATKSVAHGV